MQGVADRVEAEFRSALLVALQGEAFSRMKRLPKPDSILKGKAKAKPLPADLHHNMRSWGAFLRARK